MNGVLLVDKPRGRSSHDVVLRCRRALGTRAIGHAGTLDPMATGVLVLAIGEATKLVPYLTAADKKYEATLVLGTETDSLDADGTVVRTQEIPRGLSVARVEEAAAPLRGSTEQRAPRVSAIKVNGRALHERVRRGEDVEAPLRRVELHALEVLEVTDERIRFRLHCGKGFYVRSFGRDLADALGTVGHLDALRRLASGSFSIEQAVPFALVETAISDEAARRSLVDALLPVDRAALACLPRVDLSETATTDAVHGRPIPIERAATTSLDVFEPEATLALFGVDGRLVALGRREGSILRVVRGIRS